MRKFTLTTAAAATTALLLLAGCGTDRPMPAPTASMPNNPQQDTGSMALPANRPAGNIATTTVR